MKNSEKETIEAASPMRLFFEDEAPRIGSGWRTVEVKVGRKWVFFTDTSNGNRVRLPVTEALPIITGSIERSSR